MGRTDRILREHDYAMFDKLWNERKFAQARQLLCQMNLTARPDTDHGAEYWAKRAMCELYFFRFEEAEGCMAEAEQAYGYEKTRHVRNYLRDLAIAIIRWDKPLPDIVRERLKSVGGSFEDLLRLSRQSDDRNDCAIAHSIVGRHHLKASYMANRRSLRHIELEQAIEEFMLADTIFARLGDAANAQWRMNNRFHWFVALRHLDSLKSEEMKQMHELYRSIVSEDPSFKKRILAHTIMWWRGFGLAVARSRS